MSWVTIIWSTIASACITLAGIYLLVWCRNRTAWANLLFSLTAVAAAGFAFCELSMMLASRAAMARVGDLRPAYLRATA
jgi:two-component system sensor kinase FixL